MLNISIPFMNYGYHFFSLPRDNRRRSIYRVYIFVRKRFHFHEQNSIRVYILQTAHQMIYRALPNKKLSLATKI